MTGQILKTLKIGNFKAFADTQAIPLKPITLIFGPNSAGKSSFIHSLAYVHEALTTGNLDAEYTDIGGTSIDLGGFRQFVHKGNRDGFVEWGAEMDVSSLSGPIADQLVSVRTITVSVLIGLEGALNLNWVFDEKAPNPETDPLARETDPSVVVMAYELIADDNSLLRMSRRRDGLLRLDKLDRDHGIVQRMLRALVELHTTTQSISAQDDQVLTEAVDQCVPQISARIHRMLPEIVIERSTDPAESLLRPVGRGTREADLSNAVRFFFPRFLSDLLRGVHNVLRGQFETLNYLGPLRSFPPRHLAFSEQEDRNWYAGGGYAWDVVRKNALVRERVNSWLGDASRLSTPYKLSIRNLLTIDDLQNDYKSQVEKLENAYVEDQDDFSGDLFGDVYGMLDQLKNKERTLSSVQDLVLVDQNADTPVSHRDVGIGISQVLPVLVAVFGSDNKILAIEQPEIHLHPALQAELGDVFIEAAVGGRCNTILLETHSEHLILRLLRRIRETTDGELPEGMTPLRANQVSVIYVQPDKTGSRIVELRVTDEGEFLDRWPKGFFEERAKELF